jgi:hypothetical protein
VGRGATAIGAGDDGTSGGVYGTFEYIVSSAHDVVARVFVKDRGEERVGEDALADVADSGSPEALTEGTSIRSVVGTAVGEVRPSRRGNPSGERKKGDGVF